MLWSIVVLLGVLQTSDGYPIVKGGNVTLNSIPKKNPTVMHQFLVSVNQKRAQSARDFDMRVERIVEDLKLTEKALEFSKSCSDLNSEDDYIATFSYGLDVPSEALNPHRDAIGCAFNYNCTDERRSRTLCLFHSPHNEIESCAFGILKKDDWRIFCNPPPTPVPDYTVPKFVTACLMFSLFFCFMFGFGVLNHMIEIHNMRR